MTQANSLCPDCEQGNLSEHTHSLQLQHKGQTLTVEGLRYWLCDNCEAEIIRADQIRDGDRLIAEAKRQADGLLSGAEIRALRRRLKLSQHQAAALFGGGQNAFSKYERGEVIQSTAMDRLMRLAAWKDENFRELERLSGIEPSTPKHEEKTEVRSSNVVRLTLPSPDVERHRRMHMTGWHNAEVAEA